MLEPGDPAPAIALSDQHGDARHCRPAAARYTVVYFYPRADTPGCTTEACSFRDEWDAFEGADVAVVGISDDSVGDLEPFAEEYDLPFTLLSDPDGEVASAYDSYGENRCSVTLSTVCVPEHVRDRRRRDDRARLRGRFPENHAVEILDDIDVLDG